MNEGRTGHRGTMIFGTFLGFAGALLDFYSGYQLLSQPSMSSAPEVWGFGILSLGAVLAVTTLASAYSPWTDRMAEFGSLMVVYGLVMLFIGSAMYSGLISMLQGGFFSGLAMIAVGALMILNGGWMWRSPRMRVSRVGPNLEDHP